MKKYGLVIIMALCVAVGGVFATWTFAQGEVADADQSIGIDIEDANLVTTKGTIQVENNLKVYIDQSVGSYNAELKLDGNVTITFVPNDGADADVVNSGIAMQYAITAPDKQYLDAAIFEADGGTFALGEGATKKVVLSASDIASHIRLASTINLPNYQTYSDFKSALSGATIKLTISEVK